MNSRNLFISNSYKTFLTIVLVLLALGCGKLSSHVQNPANEVPTDVGNSININTATEAELEKIPRIGPKLAKDIVGFRKKYGPFRRPEHLMLIQGISDQRFREIRNYIRVE